MGSIYYPTPHSDGASTGALPRPGGVAAGMGSAAESLTVGFALDLLHAPAGATGIWTSGPGESALLTVLAAREARPHVLRPQIVLPDTAAPVWTRAAGILGVEPVVVPTDDGHRAPVGPMARAMGERAVLALASAPCPAYGVIDPVTWIGTAALATGVPLHVDAGDGGWLLACAERLGLVVTSWAFRNDGVASISLDLPLATGRPASLLLHRTGAPVPLTPLDRADAVAGPDDPDRYLHVAGATLRATERLRAAINDAEGLHLAAEPEAHIVVARAGADCDVFTVAEQLAARGWHGVAQPSRGDLPATLRLSVDESVRDRVEDCAAAVLGAARAARALGPVRLPTRVLDQLARLDPSTVGPHDVALLVEALGLEVGAAAGAARFGALVDAAAPPLREAIVAGHAALLTAPVRG